MVSGRLWRSGGRPSGLPPGAFAGLSHSELLLFSAGLDRRTLAGAAAQCRASELLVTFDPHPAGAGRRAGKTCVVGTTARASKENVRSIGYSIYYTLVNIGGARGPYIASWVHHHMRVENVFRVAALSVLPMFFVVLLLFKEPRAGATSRPQA